VGPPSTPGPLTSRNRKGLVITMKHGMSLISNACSHQSACPYPRKTRKRRKYLPQVGPKDCRPGHRAVRGHAGVVFGVEVTDQLLDLVQQVPDARQFAALAPVLQLSRLYEDNRTSRVPAPWRTFVCSRSPVFRRERSLTDFSRKHQQGAAAHFALGRA
jgi:hypothetical protein